MKRDEFLNELKKNLMKKISFDEDGLIYFDNKTPEEFIFEKLNKLYPTHIIEYDDMVDLVEELYDYIDIKRNKIIIVNS